MTPPLATGRRGRAKDAPAPIVTIEGEEARALLPEGTIARMDLPALIAALDPPLPVSGGAVLPDGVKCAFRSRQRCVLVHQSPPAIYKFRWIAPGSQAPYGPGASYREVRLSLPYLVVLALFEVGRQGLPRLSQRNECFFVNQPLDRAGVETELCYPALLNCSRFPDEPGRPLAWICTQHLPPRAYARGRTLEASLRDGMSALLHHLLETGFNFSSEHHELSSWYSESVEAGIDARIASVEAWEQATREDPLFVLDVPWLSTGRSLRAIAERMIAQGGRRSCEVRDSSDVARLIVNHGARTRRSRGTG